MTVAITRLDSSAADLRERAARIEDAKAARRMLAIALAPLSQLAPDSRNFVAL
jgi:hypothetical protein